MRWRWQRLNSCEKAERRQSFFLQGLSECWVCRGAKMFFASAEEQNKQEENVPLLSWRKGELRKTVKS